MDRCLEFLKLAFFQWFSYLEITDSMVAHLYKAVGHIIMPLRHCSVICTAVVIVSEVETVEESDFVCVVSFQT